LNAYQKAFQKSRVNPLLILSNIMRGLSSEADEFLDKSWALFSRYIVHGLLDSRDESKINDIILGAEKLAQRFKVEFNKRSPDTMLEAATLLYFILRSSGVLERYRAALVEPVLDFISRECIGFHSSGLVVLEASPALSRCLGLSYIFLDELDGEQRRILEELITYCGEPGPRHLYFCMHAAFSDTLRAIASKGGGDAACKRVTSLYKQIKQITKSTTLESIAFTLLVIGLSRQVGCSTEESAISLFQRLARKIEEHRAALPRKDRVMWQILALALRLNKLEKLAYVTAEYVIVKKETLRLMADIIKGRRIRWSLIATGIGIIISSVLSIISSSNIFPVIVLLAPMYFTFLLLMLEERKFHKVEEELRRQGLEEVLK